MGQSSSAVQNWDGFALFGELQLLVDLKGQIAFISKGDKKREKKRGGERERERGGQCWAAEATTRPLRANTHTRKQRLHTHPCALLQAHIYENMYSLHPHHVLLTLKVDQNGNQSHCTHTHTRLPSTTECF